MPILDSLEDVLGHSISTHGIPAASIAVSHKGERYEASQGILNLNTGVTATPESAFQIGSITKLFTATLIMQLVEHGTLSLEEPIVSYLPDFKLLDMNAARKITTRHLLTHSSGMVGDVDIDTGSGHDRIRRLVEQCCFLPMLHKVGEHASYCNVGWDIAGHLAEVLSGRTWDQLMSERILDPLNLATAFTRPEDAPKYRVAVGHAQTDDGLRVAESAYPPLCSAPSGTTTTMSAPDLLTFAEQFLGDEGSGGSNLLQPSTISEMTTPQFVVNEAFSWGLGWMISDYQGVRMIQHGGTTLGQTSYLAALPKEDLAIVILTNSEAGEACYADLSNAVLSQLADIEVPTPAPPKANPDLPADDFAGSYNTGKHALDIYTEDGEAFLRVSPNDKALTGNLNHMLFQLQPITPDRCTIIDSKSGKQSIVESVDRDSQGSPRFLRFGARLARRVNE